MTNPAQAPGAAPPASLPLADNWYALEWQAHSILRIWEPHVSRLLRANMFLVRGRERDLLVDAGMGVKPLRPVLDPLLDKPVSLLLTHAHVDHVGAASEFADDVVIHALEAPVLADPPSDWVLDYSGFPEPRKAGLRRAGFETEGALIAALPYPGFNPMAWRIPPLTPTATVEEGDRIDLGGRTFEVLHLPGHSPGSVGLWEAETGILIGGDAVYDGLIIDTLPESDPEVYRETMRRIGALGARIIHGGHRESFGADKLAQIVEGYLSGPRQR